jgi:predicted phage tail protein
MVSVKLHGVFEDFIKTDWKLNVSTVLEIFEAIQANSNKLISTLGVLDEYLSHFIIYVDGKVVPPEYINSPILKKDSKVEVVPLILGSAELAIGIALMLIGTGIQMLITKLLTPKSPVDIKTVSRLFSNYENVSLRNVPVPIGYGRYKIGSVVVSNNIQFISYASNGLAPELYDLYKNYVIVE